MSTVIIIIISLFDPLGRPPKDLECITCNSTSKDSACWKNPTDDSIPRQKCSDDSSGCQSSYMNNSMQGKTTWTYVHNRIQLVVYVHSAYIDGIWILKSSADQYTYFAAWSCTNPLLIILYIF